MNLNQVTVAVTDIERSVAFYQTLGLKLIVLAEHYARFECPEGDSTFSIHRTTAPVNGGTWIYFEVADTGGYVQELANKGIAVEEMPEDKPWLWREARLKDPDNNQLVLYTAGANRKNPPWKIKS